MGTQNYTETSQLQELRTTKSISTRKAREIIEKAAAEGRASLFEFEAEQVARLYGIPVARGLVAKSENQALNAARKLKFPLVMKIISRDVIHKTDVGGVFSGISSYSGVRQAFREINQNVRKANSKANVLGVYVQKMAVKTHEFIVGGLRDPQFGPTVMFGLGGLFVELFKDTSFRIAPLSHEDALSMMEEIKAAPLLTGFRGSKPLSTESAAEVIVAVGRMMRDLQVESIDINPLFIYQKGVIAVDVRMILK